MPGPMEGVRVVELGVWVAGPAAGGILADWGADVVKIEPPAGDPARAFRRMLGGVLPSNPVFELDNRNKRSIVLDLRTPDGMEVALGLIDRADVFVSNIRTGALRRLGLDPDALLARNPRLIYCALTAYGLEGDDVDRPAFDIAAFWARAGIAHMLTPPGSPPPFQRGGMGDHNTGLAGAAAISAALFHRERTGEGQLVSTSLLREGAYTLGFDINTALMWGVDIEVGHRSTAAVTATYYRTSDERYVWIIGLEPDRQWPPLCRAVGHPEWIDDERFATTPARMQHNDEARALLDAEFARHTYEEWTTRFATEPELIWAPVNSIQDLIADPQSAAAGLWVDVPDPMSTTTMVATPVDFHGTPWEARSIAPELGEHAEQILTELGYDDEAIASLRSAGALG